MAVEARYKAIVSVVDQTAGPLAAINARIEGIGAPIRLIGDRFDNLGNQLSRLSNNVGLTQVGRSVDVLGSRVVGLTGRLAAMAAPWASLAAVGATVGLVTMTVAAADAGDNLGDLAARTGIASDRLQILQDMAMRAGVDAEGLTTGITKLSKGIAEAAAGKNKDLAALFTQLRIPLRDTNGHLRDANALLPELADAFKRTGDQAMRDRMAIALFGRAGAALLPALVNGREALDEATERFERFGYAVDTTVSSAADAQFKNLEMAVRGVGQAVAEGVMPTLGQAAEDMAIWAVANREWIATEISTRVKEMDVAVRSFITNDWPGLKTSIVENATAFKEWLDSVGGVKTLLIGFGVLAAAPFIASLVSIGAAVATLTLSIGGLLARLTLLAATAPGALAAARVAATAQSAGISVASQAGPALASNLPAAAGALARLAVPVAAAVALHQGLGLLGEQRDQTGERTREQLRNFRQRGRLRGFYADDAADDPTSPVDESASPLRDLRLLPLALRSPSLLDSPATRDRPGQVEVRVQFSNVPPGVRVEGEANGPGVAQPELEVGYGMGPRP